MNNGELDVHSFNHSRSSPQRSPSRRSIAASNGDCSRSEADYASDVESVTTADTIIRWSTPPPTFHQSLENTQSEATLRPIRINTTHDTDAVLKVDTRVVADPAEVLSGDRQSRAAETSVRMAEFDSASPTPNSDDTPYIRFAIDQITRGDGVKLNQRPGTPTSVDSYPVERIVPDEGLGYAQSIRKVRGAPIISIEPAKSQNEQFIPVEPPIESAKYPSLRFRPMILRTFSMMILILLCLIMIIALIFSAIYPSYHGGFAPYASGLTNAQFFLFGFLPQILAAFVFVYIECVMSAVIRVVPFTMMASNDQKQRSNALFVGLYATCFLWPRFDYHSSGEPLLFVCSVLLWPIAFTIPLQSSLFSVILVDGVWRWTTVQGIVWTLVGIYLLAMVSLVGIWLYFRQRTTGLIWDPRTLADIIALFPRSNCLEAYQDSEVLANEVELREKLSPVTQRLGYWRTNNPAQELIYCIGEKGVAVRRYSKDEKIQKKTPDRHQEKLTPDLEASSPQPLLSHGTNSSLLAKVYSPAIRFRYIPWFLNDTFILLWPIAAFSILVALIIISFLPSTALRDGFPPLIAVAPDSAGFSPAGFLYSFIPSLLGILIYLTFQSVTLTLSRLAPWAILSNPSGSTASKSILLDYAASASIPFSCIIPALSNGHYLIAIFSAITPLTLLLPILAGGVFFPLEALPSGDVLVFTNMPAFCTILTVLVFCVMCLICAAISLLSHNGSGAGIGRRRYHLAHPVTCLGEIISFLYASELVRDAAFRAVRSNVDLRTRLVGRKERTKGGYGGEEVRYTFGIFKGDDDQSHLGVTRVGADRGDRPNLGGGEAGRSRSRFSL